MGSDSWTVVRRWRGVKATTATEAIQTTRPEVQVMEDGVLRVVSSHDDLSVTHCELTMLYHSKSELEALLALVVPAMEEAKGQQLQMLNSLRTQLAEARWELMSPAEIEQEFSTRRQVGESPVS